MDILLALGFVLSCFAFVGLVAVLFINIDRVITMLMRCLHIYAFPTAIGIAMSIMEHPDQWTSDRFHLLHSDIGSIWIANAAYGLHIETPYGDWKPNFIERRIIRDAVDWRIQRYIKARIHAAIQRNALRNGN